MHTEREQNLFHEESEGEDSLKYQVEVTCKIRPAVDGAKPYSVPLLSSELPADRVLECVALAVKSEKFKVVMTSILGEQLPTVQRF